MKLAKEGENSMPVFRRTRIRFVLASLLRSVWEGL